MEKKRAEMMQNAKWRQEQREKNVKQYKAEDEKESAMLNKLQELNQGEAFLKYEHLYFMIENHSLDQVS